MRKWFCGTLKLPSNRVIPSPEDIIFGMLYLIYWVTKKNLIKICFSWYNFLHQLLFDTMSCFLNKFLALDFNILPDDKRSWKMPKRAKIFCEGVKFSCKLPKLFCMINLNYIIRLKSSQNIFLFRWIVFWWLPIPSDTLKQICQSVSNNIWYICEKVQNGCLV